MVHKSSKLMVGGCESCPAVVRMLWSFVCAFECAFCQLPTRPDGRDPGSNTRNRDSNTRKFQKLGRPCATQNFLGGDSRGTLLEVACIFGIKKPLGTLGNAVPVLGNAVPTLGNLKNLKIFIFCFFDFGDRLYINTTAPDLLTARGPARRSRSSYFIWSPKVELVLSENPLTVYRLKPVPKW